LRFEPACTVEVFRRFLHKVHALAVELRELPGRDELVPEGKKSAVWAVFNRFGAYHWSASRITYRYNRDRRWKSHTENPIRATASQDGIDGSSADKSLP